jgi:hypothetical protein
MPIVEYNSTGWNPCSAFLIDLFESVHRSFAKRIPSISNFTYAERLALLDLDTLELRRLRFDLIFYYKIFKPSKILRSTDKKPVDFFL